MSATVFPALCLAFAAFAVWLTVRLVNRQERWAKRTAIGMGAALVLFVVLAPVLQTIKWCGDTALTVNVSVFDAETAKPMLNAKVVVFAGPSELKDGILRIEPDDSDYRTQRCSTNATGKATAQHPFFAYGSENLLVDSGWIRFDDHYIRIESSGYEPAQFQVAERTGQRRDYHDKSPLELTVKLTPTAKE
jgi:hypothetical protein